jgi:ferredoxin
MKLRAELDSARCIGCLACTRCNNFVCGNDFKARAVRAELDEIGCNQEAAVICPVGAIIISGPDLKVANPDKGGKFKWLIRLNS